MDCKRFEDQLMDAALGGLPPERETELRAHLRECAPCRAESERQQQLVAAMDNTFDRMAAAEPSPEMVVRIRLKIAEQPAPSRGWLVSWWPAATGALAAAALVAYLMIPHTTVPQAGREQPVTVTPPPAQVANALPPVEAKPPRQPRRPAAAAARPAEPEVLVPRDQERAVAWLYRAMQSQPQRMTALLAREARNKEEQAKPLELARLSIPPLEIGPLETQSPDGENRQ